MTFRWIMYTAQNIPGNISSDLTCVGSLADAKLDFAAYCATVGTDNCHARLYPYSDEDWASAEEFREIGCPFDYPSKLVQMGPRGGVTVVNA